MPTGKDYNTEAIDIRVRMPDDEWQNASLWPGHSPVKVMAMQAEYYKALNNSDISYLRRQIRIDSEILAQSKIVREKSFTAAMKDSDYADMLTAYKRCCFRMMRIMQNYVLDWYYEKLIVTGRGGSAIDVAMGNKVGGKAGYENGTATGRGGQ